MDSTERPAMNVRCLVGLCIAQALAGCSALGPRQSPLPSGGPTVAEIYKTHSETEGAGGSSAGTRLRERLPLRAADDAELSEARRTTLDPLQQRFERLPNPDLVMHVFPHLARGRYPVPGYVTVFPMYERVEYAMPGEVGRLAPPLRSATQGQSGNVAREECTSSAAQKGDDACSKR